MKKKSSLGYAAKHDPSVTLDEALAEALKTEVEDGGVSCRNAHAVAGGQNKTPRESGTVLDLLNLRIVRCQLGLFGYAPRKRIVQPAGTIDPQLANAIQAALENGRLRCDAAWAIAARCQLPRMAVAETCEALKIKIGDCQLGAF